MEFLNKVEIKGIVGMSDTQKYAHTSMTKFSVVTEYSYKSADGTDTIETTWWCCTKVYGKGEPLLLKRGDKVHVIGRLRINRYADDSGLVPIERTLNEVVVQRVEILDRATEDSK